MDELNLAARYYFYYSGEGVKSQTVVSPMIMGEKDKRPGAKWGLLLYTIQESNAVRYVSRVGEYGQCQGVACTKGDNIWRGDLT